MSQTLNLTAKFFCKYKRSDLLIHSPSLQSLWSCYMLVEVGPMKANNRRLIWQRLSKVTSKIQHRPLPSKWKKWLCWLMWGRASAAGPPGARFPSRAPLCWGSRAWAPSPLMFRGNLQVGHEVSCSSQERRQELQEEICDTVNSAAL